MTPLKCHPSISDVDADADVDAKADSEAVAEVILRTGAAAAAAFWPLCVGIAVLDLGYER